MTEPVYADKWFSIYCGDALEVMQSLPDESANCCVTSPPYFGLRSYMPREWESGNPDYQHSSEIGQERTIECYINRLVLVFREVRRILKKDGTCWMVIGDSYAGSWGNYGGQNRGNGHQREIKVGSLPSKAWDGREKERPASSMIELPRKNLMMVPARTALAMQTDGWILRQEIIWYKPNCMPESVKDRCTRSHETIFMLTKSPNYYYDANAISEPLSRGEDLYRKKPAISGGNKHPGYESRKYSGRAYHAGPNSHCNKSHVPGNPANTIPFNERHAITGKKNKRDVWTVAPRGFPGSHYATFPYELIKPCILAGCPEGGIVLDPFVGSGTTLLAAFKHGRRSIGIDLNPDYVKMALLRWVGIKI